MRIFNLYFFRCFRFIIVHHMLSPFNNKNTLLMT